MNRIASLKLGVAATTAALGLYIGAVRACGYDSPMVDLVVAHPRSIEVALAVRNAYDHGELHALAPVPPVLGLVRANGMLQSFRPLVSAVAGSPNTSVAVLLIEEGLWARYSMSAAGMATELHVGGPLDGEPVIVTSESALHALLDGTLTPQRATELGVLIVVRST
jgi:hypothetical protein